jgi:hypothetical protein
VVPAPPGAAVPDDRLLFLGDDQHGWQSKLRQSSLNGETFWSSMP